MSLRVAITGANRGIGLGLVRAYLSRGDQVEALVREPARATELHALVGAHPGRLRVHACDVCSDASVSAAADAIGASTALDVLINNAGVIGAGGWGQPLDELDLRDVAAVYEANAIGPLRVSRALLGNLRLGSRKVLAHISTGMASIADNTSGGSYAYRMSKAALNMASKCLAIELRGEDFVSVVFNPGWVQTDMGGAGAPTTVEESAAGLLARIDELRPTHSGAFLDYRPGRTLPW